jgi:Glyoxalase/Bleomycin resistance protein/Dioxygenase superfamily
MLSAAEATHRILGTSGASSHDSDITRPVIQLGFTVDDIETAANQWHRACGAGPFFRIGRGPLELADTRHRGEPAQWSHSTSAGWCGGVMIELTEQHAAYPATLAQAMGVGGYGLNHVAWLVDDMQLESDRLERLGIPLIMAATLGQQEFRFHDARAQLGFRVEFYRPLPDVVDVYDGVRRAALESDGSDIVRPLSSLRRTPC